VDGVAVGRSTLPTPMNFNGGNVQIRDWIDCAYNPPFNGCMADVAVYWQPLSAERIDAHDAAGVGLRSTIASSITPPGLVFAAAGMAAANAAVTLGVVLFITFPSQIFNHTFQENYPEISARWRRRFGWIGQLGRLAGAWNCRVRSARRRRGCTPGWRRRRPRSGWCSLPSCSSAPP